MHPHDEQHPRPESRTEAATRDQQRADTEQAESDIRAGITEAIACLDELDELPLSAHVERFEAVHTQLTVALSDIDKA
ncbi:hypothetical protein [Haloechinothrix sp. LS1_15]|uniref:hypothetical protein n=1 Tax=Haloechinothrix sp. LS1_15 TaxID=2652248 RepID=UPI0029451D76|nr:hypothetical protein [Haloechinothrix sp. LS1_15]MDV6013439.1 hypothetical protein [Haloechinothrix sp. LS1_15]